MNSLDIVISIAVIVGFILGYKDGFVRKVIGIIGFLIAIVLAALFANDLGAMVEYAFGIELYLSEIIAGLIIFFGIILLTTLLKRVVHPFDKVNNLINQLVGGTVGIIQILYFLSALFLIVNIFNLPDKPTREKSNFYSSVYQILPATIDYIKDYTPDTKQFIKDYIEQKDTLK